MIKLFLYKKENPLFQKKTPYEKEWELLLKKENKFLEKRQEKKESSLTKKLEENIPEKLQETLNTAFAKAFSLVFEKGTGIIEKTYKKEEIEQNFQINQYANKIKQSRKSLQTFSKQAKGTGMKNMLLSGVSGIGMGVLGIGIPDIPVFTAMLLKNLYEIALHFGYHYDSPQEQYFILLLIQGGVSCGEDMLVIDKAIQDYINTNHLPPSYQKEEMIQKTASCLSKELLYMKFLQGIPVVGAVGGAYDVIYLKQITEYANLKYQKRFLQSFVIEKEKGIKNEYAT